MSCDRALDSRLRGNDKRGSRNDRGRDGKYDKKLGECFYSLSIAKIGKERQERKMRHLNFLSSSTVFDFILFLVILGIFFPKKMSGDPHPLSSS